MGLSLLPLPQQYTLFSPPFSIRSRQTRKAPTVTLCRCSLSSSGDSAKAELAPLALRPEGRRALLACLLLSAAGAYVSDAAHAVSTSRRALRGEKIPESDFKTLPNGLKYYDIKVGGGAEAVKGSRVAVHYVAKWKGITFMTSRQGLGVGGGTRLLIVPPELAYGSKGVQEIPPNATIELDVELLTIKQSPFGSPVKVIEG